MNEKKSIHPIKPQFHYEKMLLKSSVIIFASLKGEEPRHVYDFFLDEIEEPLLAAVMKFTRSNQSETARILGLSRGTLRTKLKKYGML